MLALFLGVIFGITRADTYQLTDGQSMTGELTSPNSDGVIIKLPDGKYSDRVPWDKFLQDDLKKLNENPKFTQFVQDHIEVTQEEKMKRTEVPTELPPRLVRPEPKALLSAMWSSGLGIFVLLLLYAATIYSAYEVAIFKSRPPGLVCGLAAIPFVGIASPIAFLIMPSRLRAMSEETDENMPASVAENPSYAVRPGQAPPPGIPSSHPSARTPRPAPPPPPPPPRREQPAEEPALEAEAPEPNLRLAQETPKPDAEIPQTQIFQRGAFMFNRRFFETKFPGFFGVARRDADKDMILYIKAVRGEYLAERISRISANEVHVQCRKHDATEEIMVPFSEIKEIHLKHKNAP